MSRHEVLPALLTRLMEAACFEDAATAALEAVLACAEEAVAESRFATSARLLRAMVHLRPSDGYQRLFGVEHRTGAQLEGTGYLTSANVWRWVAERRCAVSIDVQLGILHARLPDGSIERSEPQEAAGVPGYETRQRMLGRDATHVHVIPLRAPGGGIAGMIALEAHAKAAIGREFVWGNCEEQLELIASAAAPYLGALPPRPVRGAPTDALLPVVGRATAGLIEVLRVFAQQEETVLVSGPTGRTGSPLVQTSSPLSHEG